jgi:hypothetical protein
MGKQVTILEGIIDEIKLALFQKWVNNVPQDQQTDEALAPLAANAMKQQKSCKSKTSVD